MKLLFEIFFSMLAIGCAMGELKRCTKQSDCNIPAECCSKRMGTLNIAYCVQRRQLNEICLGGVMGQTMMNGTYDITCPCAKGLECVKPAYYDEYGRLIYTRNPTCQEVGWEQPPLEYYYNEVNTDYANYRPGYAYASSYGRK